MVSVTDNSPPPSSLPGGALCRPAVPPKQLVAPLLVRGVLHHLPRCGCQYRSVYRHKGNKWRATVKIVRHDAGGAPHPEMRHVATRCRTPLDAAVALARWYERWLGADWGWIVSAHRKHLWRHAPWQVRYSAKRGAFVMAVWVDGQRREVVNGRGGLAEFRSREEAESALHPWLESRVGENGYLRMWRKREESRKFP